MLVSNTALTLRFVCVYAHIDVHTRIRPSPTAREGVAIYDMLC